MTAPTAAPCAPAKAWTITQAPAVPEKPSTAPTDRSIPPAQMTNVSPTASSSTSVAVLEVFSQLARVRKYGEPMLNAAMSTSSTPPIHRSRTAAWPRSHSARCRGTADVSGRSFTPVMAGLPRRQTGRR